ncbi:hypothetical protein ACU42Y_09935 [Proteus mirabilis]
MDSLESGLVFTCTIGGLPDDTFQVTEFNLTEGLSSLFSLSISAVSACPPFYPFPAPSWLSLIINGQTRWGVDRKVNGILAGQYKAIPTEAKTRHHFEYRPKCG